jgi:hypothetical protein
VEDTRNREEKIRENEKRKDDWKIKEREEIKKEIRGKVR